MPVFSAGRIGYEKRDGTCADFLMSAISGASTVRAHTYAFGLNLETSGRDSLSLMKYDHP